ncbi:MAG TPA: 6-phospho-beta-glucosidase [Armatimonadota bacterium]|jgi:6-phospho-beta-glucosidase
MIPLKIAVIGGGSTYTPELVEGFLHGMPPVREIALMDIDAPKLAIVGGLAQRMASAAWSTVSVTLTTELARVLDGADIVITQLRVGGLAARVLDERIPIAHGLIGQETTGPGGFFKALRTIPVLLDINRAMARYCPDAWLINFTNPSGLVTEALRVYGRAQFVGLCNYPLTLKMHIAQALDVEESRLELAYFGLNHLSWARVLVDSVDRTGEVIDLMLTKPECRELSGFAFAPERLRALGLIPSGYLRYFYERERMERELQAAKQTRGERVQDMERVLLAQYADPALREKPAGLQERGGAWYSTAAVRLVRDLLNDSGGVHVLNVANETSLPMLPPEVIVETPAHVAHGTIGSRAVVTGEGAEARVAGQPIPGEVISLIQRVKAYELLAVEAAVTGSRGVALAALAAHPLLDGRHNILPQLFDELLLAHQQYLPLFFVHDKAG